MKPNGIFFWIGAGLFLAAALLMTQVIGNQYPFFAGYVILQFIVLAVAWSILGGYAGYVNFGTSAFFGIGVYTAVFLVKAVGAPLAVQIAAAAAVGGLMGFALGLLTLRMQGIFFSIATIALTIIIETSMTNWRYVGGAAGIQIQRPPVTEPFSNYVQMLFFVQALLVVLAVAISRYIQNSWIGRGLQALRDDELAAECTGVPTLRLKLLACAISGAPTRAAGAPAAMYLQYADPALRVQPQLLRLGARDVADWRNRALGWPDHRRDPVEHDATIADRHHLVGSKRAGTRRDAGVVRGGRAGGHHWPDPKALTVRNSTITGNTARLGGGVLSWNDAANSHRRPEQHDRVQHRDRSRSRRDRRDGVFTFPGTIVTGNIFKRPPEQLRRHDHLARKQPRGRHRLRRSPPAATFGPPPGARLPRPTTGARPTPSPDLSASPARRAVVGGCPARHRSARHDRPQGASCDIGAYELVSAAAERRLDRIGPPQTATAARQRLERRRPARASPIPRRRSRTPSGTRGRRAPTESRRSRSTPRSPAPSPSTPAGRSAS